MTRSFRTFWSYEPYLSAVLGSFLDGIRSSSYSLTLGGGGVSPSGTLAGKLPKNKQRLVFANNEFSVKSVQEDLVAERPIRDATELRETLEIRARCFHMLKVCEFEVCRKLTERYLSKLRATQAEGMRGPTLNEIRRADLEIFNYILSWVAKGEGTVQNGLAAMLEDQAHHFWRLLDPQVKSFPDQGRDQKVAEPKEKPGAKSQDEGKKRTREEVESPEDWAPAKARM